MEVEQRSSFLNLTIHTSHKPITKAHEFCNTSHQPPALVPCALWGGGVRVAGMKRLSCALSLAFVLGGCSEPTLLERAELGDLQAQVKLGIAYTIGDGVTEDDAEAVKWWRKAAEQGDAGAQFMLGSAYENGRGVAKDEVEAFKWYAKSAEKGVPDAQYNLGDAYAYGEGVAEDRAEAVKWWRKAAEQGLEHAQYSLGLEYGGTGEYDEAYKWIRKAAEQGLAEAKEFLKEIPDE